MKMIDAMKCPLFWRAVITIIIIMMLLVKGVSLWYFIMVMSVYMVIEYLMQRFINPVDKKV